MKLNRKAKKIMWVILSIIVVLVAVGIIFMSRPQFGSTPKGERLERVKNSPNYRDGKFQNLHETQQITSEGGFFSAMGDFLFKKKERLRPKSALPVIKTNLWELNRDDDLLIWFGHSSYLLQIDGLRILVDPVFVDASPVSFYNKPFKVTNIYAPDDIPEIDFLVISHDHFDHLDYKTVAALRNRVGKIVCSLGVGQHFERWGFDMANVVEMDWNERRTFDNGVVLHCLPTRHFSGRSLNLNQSLWASFLFEMPLQKIYIGGDGGYDAYYAEIGRQFGEIDLAILENGQYNKDWRYIHFLPEDIIRTFKDLNAKRLFTVHHSKYALAYHPWDEPLKNIASFAERDSINLILPMIGEPVDLNREGAYVNRWWEGIE